MITLQALDNAVKFTFDDNQHYLFNGTIEVPLNALTLVTDDSEMATFKKAATNDIFLSCLYSELGMTKSELESFYKENMVGGGTDEEEVQELIDAAVVNFFDGVEYDNQTSRINFKHGSTIKGYIDAAPFIVDGMVSNVEILNGNLVISFNTDAGKQPISIPLTDIFNPNNYYDKNEVDGLLNDKLNITDFHVFLDNVVTSISEIDAGMAEDEEVTASALNDLKAKIDKKQDTLVSGTNIKTINNESIIGSGNITIDATVDAALDSGSTNAVANSAITNAINVVSSATEANTTALGGLSLVKLTQAEYDALTEKDSMTLYII